MTEEPRSLHILAIDPFFGGSHRQFLDSVRDRSRHRWTVLGGKPVHWKWRMRSAPLEMAAATKDVLRGGDPPDLVFCTEMLDLAQWRGIVRDSRLTVLPTVVYFHESQWAYPLHPDARVDFHYGYTNLITALEADACWFNSRFHLDEFLRESRSFISRMPDGRDLHPIDDLARNSKVISPGFVAREVTRSGGSRVRIGWVSRWEHDKRPDRFVELLDQLRQDGVDFDLVLLGSRPSRSCESLSCIRDRHGGAILHDRYVESADDYWTWLGRIDVVVSTADHEYFGIAICEAIWAGAVPVVPDRLSYPELVPDECRYDSVEAAAALIAEYSHVDRRDTMVPKCREQIELFSSQRTIDTIDEAIDDLAAP